MVPEEIVTFFTTGRVCTSGKRKSGKLKPGWQIEISSVMKPRPGRAGKWHDIPGNRQEICNTSFFAWFGIGNFVNTVLPGSSNEPGMADFGHWKWYI
jgi:hypothetical protein